MKIDEHKIKVRQDAIGVCGKSIIESIRLESWGEKPSLYTWSVPDFIAKISRAGAMMPPK